MEERKEVLKNMEDTKVVVGRKDFTIEIKWCLLLGRRYGMWSPTDGERNPYMIVGMTNGCPEEKKVERRRWRYYMQ